MFSVKKYRLFSVFNIPVYVDISFIGLAVLLTVSTGSVISGPVLAVALGASILAHELGHSLTASVFGFNTADITLSLLGGCASITSLPSDSKQEILVAAAGPAVSFALACICMVPVAFGLCNTVTVGIVGINAMLGLFNLLPGFPMDGGRILRSIIGMKKPRLYATEIAMKVGRYVAVALACIGVISVCFGNFGGIVTVFVAYMIWKTGYMEYQMTRYCGGRP